MSKLLVRDLPESSELDRIAMSKVRGGRPKKSLLAPDIKAPSVLHGGIDAAAPDPSNRSASYDAPFPPAPG